jgi:hypothetical protein
MLAEMPASEFRKWEIFEQIEPFGERGEYYRNALLCLTIARCAGNKQMKLEDFIIDTLKAEPLKQSPETIKALLMAMMEKQNKWVAEQEAKKKNGGHTGD